MPFHFICEFCGAAFTRRSMCHKHHTRRPYRFCSPACAYASPDRMQRRSLTERFWRKVQKTDGCWLWIGAHDSHGYGHLYNPITKMPIRAHRVSYEIHTGPIPEGLAILHSCDNPPCVNPEHLSTGTAKANSLDAINKRRLAHGERSHSARLTNDQVIVMRRQYAAGMNGPEIARGHGIPYPTVRDVLALKTWKHA